MTTPTNSDRLREIKEFYATDVEAAKEWHSFPPTKEGDVVFLLSEIDKLNAEKAATIEVLERYPVNGWQYEHRAWYKNHGKPHLDKLKAQP